MITFHWSQYWNLMKQDLLISRIYVWEEGIVALDFRWSLVFSANCFIRDVETHTPGKWKLGGLSSSYQSGNCNQLDSLSWFSLHMFSGFRTHCLMTERSLPRSEVTSRFMEKFLEVHNEDTSYLVPLTQYSFYNHLYTHFLSMVLQAWWWLTK